MRCPFSSAVVPPHLSQGKHTPYYDEEDEELWKHFDEPEWEGILDIVP